MHELSIARAIVEKAREHSSGRPVLRVHVTVGALRQVVPDSLEFYFAIASRGTACEGAVLETHPRAAWLRCPCGFAWELESASFLCPSCGGGEASVESGEELTVDSIEVWQGSGPPPAPAVRAAG